MKLHASFFSPPRVNMDSDLGPDLPTAMRDQVESGRGASRPPCCKGRLPFRSRPTSTAVQLLGGGGDPGRPNEFMSHPTHSAPAYDTPCSRRYAVQGAAGSHCRRVPLSTLCRACKASRAEATKASSCFSSPGIRGPLPHARHISEGARYAGGGSHAQLSPALAPPFGFSATLSAFCTSGQSSSGHHCTRQLAELLAFGADGISGSCCGWLTISALTT